MGKYLDQVRQHPYFRWRKTAADSVREGGAFALMAAVGETYFPAFALAAGLGNIFSGWIVTLPLILGAVLQLFIPRLLSRMGSHRRWVILFTSLQGFSLLPLIYFSLRGQVSSPVMFGCAALYWTTGMLAGPVWNTWMSRIIPSRAYTGFFARRTRQMQMGSGFGFLLGGVMLHLLPKETWGTQIFTPLFVLAFLSRMFSIRLLRSHPDQEMKFCALPDAHSSPWAAWQELQSGSRLGRLMIYLLFMHFAVNIASPFVNPFFLDSLHFGYFEYALLISASYLGKILALPAIGRLIHRHGPGAGLRLGAVAIPLIPICFIVAPSFPAIITVQFLSGIVWASYDLSSILLLLKSIPEERRAAYLSFHQFAVTLSLVVASLLGGLLLKTGGNEAYVLIFALSFVLRGGAFFFFRRFHQTSTPPVSVKESA